MILLMACIWIIVGIIGVVLKWRYEIDQVRMNKHYDPIFEYRTRIGIICSVLACCFLGPVALFLGIVLNLGEPTLAPCLHRPIFSGGNSAFDEYKTGTLRRLEEEQNEFREFLNRLRTSKDRAEFDQFMTKK